MPFPDRSPNCSHEIDVLLVDDNRTDVQLVREALSAWATPPRLWVVEDGEQAILFLCREGLFAAVPVPDLVFLDLNLPKVDGIEVLRRVRANSQLSSIPVIVITTSDRQRDVLQAYSLHANCYLTKPLEFQAFKDQMSAIEQFWVLHARLPQRNQRR